MLFTSLEFLLFFFPVVVLVNHLLPRRFQNIWLFLASVFFYAWGEPKFVIIMLISIAVNYLLALGIEATRGRIIFPRMILGIAVTVDLGILFVYKYMNFATSVIHRFDPAVPVTDYMLPIGISFYTFQAISYVIDVYRGEKAQTNIVYIGLYIAFFPQLIAGPIVRYIDIKDQICKRKLLPEKLSHGIFRFLTGFNKKILLANTFAIVADRSFSADGNTVVMAWLGAVCYTLQIYYDFSGYSDMAIGLAKIFGFELSENFDYPYSSKTITEFWRRWHISLGQWFRDYLYFPLGGSRVNSRSRLIFNLMFVWLMTGIWHGANTTFIAWGIAYGILISLEKLFRIPQRIERHRGLSIIYRIFTLFSVMTGWIVFRADSLHAALQYVMDMFGLRNNGSAAETDLFYLREYGLYIIAGLIFSLPVIRFLKNKMKDTGILCKDSADLCLYGANTALFVVGISYLVISAHNPFIYFNF